MRVLVLLLLAVLPLRAQFSDPAFVADLTVPTVVSYTANTAVFDGSDFMRMSSSGPTGLADSKTFTTSFWVNLSAGDGVTQYIFTLGGAGLRFYLRRVTATNVVQLVGFNAAGSTILNVLGSTAITASSGWTHIYACMDLADTGKRKIYINSAAETFTVTTYTDDSIDFVGASYLYAVSGDLAGPPALNMVSGALAEFWFNDSYLDDPTKFASGGHPISLGTDGSTPTGSSPVFYLKGSGNGFNVNSGTGGNFTITGSLGTTTPP